MNDIEADFFALGGHSLLAMRLAAQLSRAFSRKVTPGQIMVASTVSKLSALLDSQMSDEQAQRLGYETLLPLRESNGPTLFCFHPASGFARSLASRALPQPALVHRRHSVAAAKRPDAAVRGSRWGDRTSSEHVA